MKGVRFKTCLTLGAITVVSLFALSSCTDCGPLSMDCCIRNESSNYVGIVFRDGQNGSEEEQSLKNIKLDVGESDDSHLAYVLNGGYSRANMSFSIVTQDDVVDVEVVRPEYATDDADVFELEDNAAGDESVLYILTDEYIGVLADTMRTRGLEPYKISHEYVVNSTGRDFTLRCVGGGRTWEYAIASGDSAEIERRWLMEWAGADDGHYEFAFRDSSMVAWPLDAGVCDVAAALRGGAPHPRRYFDFTVSRSGGGMRRYEITDGLLAEIAREMAILRVTRPGLF